MTLPRYKIGRQGRVTRREDGVFIGTCFRDLKGWAATDVHGLRIMYTPTLLPGLFWSRATAAQALLDAAGGER